VDAKAFLQGESAKGRQTDLLKLNITPEQEKTLQQHLDSNNPNAQCAAPYSIPEGNSCVDQVQNPLIDTGILQVPTQIQVDPYNKCSHYATALNLNYKANPASCRDTDTAGESKTGFWGTLFGAPSRKQWVPMKRILLLVCALVAFVAVVGCFKRPAVKLENSGSSVIVHVETLGEYPTTVRHIRLKEASSGKVIFELLTESGTPQIYSFRLSVGDNPTIHVADPEHGFYRVAEPSGKNTFALQTGVRYRLTVWGNGWPPSETNPKF